MTKRIFSILIVALLSGCLWAQESVNDRPQRTPEEEAGKQTSRLVRELGIRDSIRIDTIYRMHLKYARARQRGLTRAQNMERMQSIYNELKQLLTADEFERFMNHPTEQPRRPHGANRMSPAVAPSVATPNKPDTHKAPQ
jgi:protein involved in sex pheromone biosynthesis